MFYVIKIYLGRARVLFKIWLMLCLPMLRKVSKLVSRRTVAGLEGQTVGENQFGNRSKITEPNAYRKHIFRQQLTWHPDKFAQKTADRLHEDDKEKILTTVHHISQALNKALENSQLV